MRAAQVQRKFPVYEDPDIIVAREIECNRARSTCCVHKITILRQLEIDVHPNAEAIVIISSAHRSPSVVEREEAIRICNRRLIARATHILRPGLPSSVCQIVLVPLVRRTGFIKMQRCRHAVIGPVGNTVPVPFRPEKRKCRILENFSDLRVPAVPAFQKRFGEIRHRRVCSVAQQIPASRSVISLQFMPRKIPRRAVIAAGRVFSMNVLDRYIRPVKFRVILTAE